MLSQRSLSADIGRRSGTKSATVSNDMGTPVLLESCLPTGARPVLPAMRAIRVHVAPYHPLVASCYTAGRRGVGYSIHSRLECRTVCRTELCREHVWPLRWKFVGDLAGSLIAIGENIPSFPPLVAWWPAPWHI